MLWIFSTPVEGIALSKTNTKPPVGLHLAAALQEMACTEKVKCGEGENLSVIKSTQGIKPT